MEERIAEQTKSIGKLGIQNMKANLSKNLIDKEVAKVSGGVDLQIIKDEYEADLARRNFDEKKIIDA